MISHSIKTKSLISIFFIIINFSAIDCIFAQSEVREPYKEEYQNYTPDFLEKIKIRGGTMDWRWWNRTEKEMERSSEVKFYTLNEVEEVNRANSLVKVAMDCEASGDYRKAMTMYQDIINKFSLNNDHNEVLYRVSSFGVFVPISQYCQKRLLNFPKEHLDFYRTLRDPEAKELFDEAVKKYSLELFSEIVDKYLATSFGGKSLLFLGDAALDRGNYLEALEHFKTIIDFIPDKNLQTPELSLKIQFCNKALGFNVNSDMGASKSNVSEKDLQLLKTAIQQETPTQSKVQSQRTSVDYISVDDYTRFKPTSDPLGLEMPEWENELPGTRNEMFVYFQPVVTDTSIIFRHKNIIYCYSIINGNLRWKNDIGGRATWQDWSQLQYPLEDILIQDGVIVTPIFKGGSSLVALDEITGQIKWSFGPIASSEGDESLMRFECAPTAGPGTVYANYILDNIKGDTHIDTEYGVIAFEISTGRVKWRRQVCRLQPGKFDGSFGLLRRNRIRSFATPPIYHEGTVYVNSNSGAITAMDGLSGRIKWLMRYPYHPGVHDLTRQFGGGWGSYMISEPSFWFNQRPLVVGEQLYVLPVDSPFMLCLDRKTGKTNWSFAKPTPGFSYLLGPISTGEMVVTGNGRVARRDGLVNGTSAPIYLLDPKTGKETWAAPDIVMKEDKPVYNSGESVSGISGGISINSNYFETASRPFLSEDDKLILTCFTTNHYWYHPGAATIALAEVDLKNKKISSQRRFYNGPMLTYADKLITSMESGDHGPLGSPLLLANMKKIPRLNKEQEKQIALLEAITKDTVPVNEHPAFMPFSRVTFTRYGIPFELRLTARKISLIYSRKSFEEKVANDKSLMSSFGKAEMCVKDGDYKKASEYLNQCLAIISPEDVNIRALIKQQFYKVYLELVKSAIRSNKPKQQMENTLGMSNTASVLSEEVESLFALAEAHSKNGAIKNAASCLRTLIEVYGQHEFPISSIAAMSMFHQEDVAQVTNTFNEIISEAKGNSGNIYKGAVEKTLDLTSSSFPLYFSAVSPLPKELTVRAGDLAILKLIDLLKNSKGFESEYNKMGASELEGDKIDQLIYHIWKYAGTEKGQETFNRICTLSLNLNEEDKRGVWRKLGHVAKICKFNLPADVKAFFGVPEKGAFKEVDPNFGDKSYVIGDFKDGIMITLEREGDLTIQPNLLFIGVKLPKKIGFRFSVVCFDLSQGREVWRKDEFRLKDLGKEPGFFKAYVYKDIVVVNGMYDVFGFNLKDGAELWHYKTPYSFEIFEAAISGNIFVLSGSNETIALQIDTKSPIGEVAWQQKEDGNLYSKPYFVNDLYISVRKYPFNITSRHRTTGSLIARLALPDLSLIESHPLVKDGTLELPVSIFDRFVAVSDQKYIIVYDVVKMEMVWKNPILNIDLSKDLKMRVTMNEKYVILVKEDYDRKAIYCYSLSTGEILWCTDPTNSGSPQAIYSMQLEGDMLYGIGMHPGQGFYFVSYDCSKGIRKVNKLIDGFASNPIVNMRKYIYGKHVALEVQDKKDFHIIALDKNSGEIVKKVSDKGDGPIGDIGRVAMTIQDGHPVLFSKVQFKY